MKFAKKLNVEPLLRIERSQIGTGRVTRMPQETSESRVLLATSSGKRLTGADKGPDDVITSTTWLDHTFMWSIYRRLMKTVRYFETSYDCCLHDLPERKNVFENEWINERNSWRFIFQLSVWRHGMWPELAIRGGHRSGVVVPTLEGFCVFLGPRSGAEGKKYVKSRTQIRSNFYFR